MPNATDPLHDNAFMEAFLNLVIPPDEDRRMPGAGSLGLGAAVAAAVETDSLLGHAVVTGLRAVRDAAVARDPAGLPGLTREARLEVLEGVLAHHPAFMTGVARHLYPAYYQHPRVLEALGEPARAPFPEGFQIEPTDAALMAKLLARRK
ncbi:MAG: hypothetical protein C0506_12510 [Anaerolinea sp.]|nr:hypothetical protein [Anaerolinea sp.]